MKKDRVSILSILLMQLFLLGCLFGIAYGLPLVEDFETWEVGPTENWLPQEGGEPIVPPEPHEFKITTEHCSPFADIFDQGTNSLLFFDGSNASSFYTIVYPEGHTENEYLFYSMDFKVIDGNAPVVLYLAQDGGANITAIRIRPGRTSPLEYREYDPGQGKVVTSYLEGAPLVIGTWYRMQLLIRGTGSVVENSPRLVDVKWHEYGKESLEFKNRNLAGNVAKPLISFRLGTSYGPVTEIGKYVVDNIILRVLDYEAASNIIIPTLPADDGATEGEIKIELKEDFYRSAAADIPITISAPEGILLQGADNTWGNSATVTTDVDGNAFFPIRGTKAGTTNLEIQVTAPWGEVQNISREIEFTEAISAENSQLQIVPESIIADGKEEATVTVIAKGYGTNPQLISGREVSMNLPEYISIAAQEPVAGKPNSMITNSEGKAIFTIKSSRPWQGAITATIDRSSEGLEPLSLESELFIFASPINIDNSFVSEPEIVHDEYNGQVPADGACSYRLAVILKDENSLPVSGFDIVVEADSSVMIEPETANSDAEGKAEFLISATASGTYTLAIKAHQQCLDLGTKTVTFVEHSSEFGPVVISTDPANGAEDVEATAPLKIRFNKPIDFSDLPENELKLTFEADGYETIICTRNTTDSFEAGLWEYDESAREITWTPTDPLPLNTQTTATLSGVVDLAGFSIAEDYIWRFTATDRLEPTVINTLPKDGEIEVAETTTLVITFSEPLKEVNGKPEGLEIIIEDSKGERDTYSSEAIQYSKAESRVEVEVSLKTDEQYQVTVQGAKDFARNLMDPHIFSFNTRDTIAPTVSNVWPAPGSVVLDQDFARKIKIAFSENVDILLPTTEANIKLEIQDEVGTWQDTGWLLEKSYDSQTYTWEAVLEGSAWQYNKSYRVTVSAVRDCIENPYGEAATPNQLAEPYSWAFQLQVSGAANVVPVAPLKDALDFPINSAIRIAFDKPVLCEPMPAVEIFIEGQQDAILGSLVWVEQFGLAATELLFTPADPLAYDTWYCVTVQGAKGENGLDQGVYTYRFRTEVLGATEPTDPSQAATLAFPIGPEGREVVLEIPADSFSTSANLAVSNVPFDDKQSLSGQIWSTDTQLTSYVYNLNSDQDVKFLEGRKATLILPYTEVDGKVETIDDSLVSENDLQICYWNTEKREWLPLTSYVDSQNNTVSAMIDSFGTYALIGGLTGPKQFLTEVILTTNPIVLGSARQQTTFRFRLAHQSRISLTLFDRSGRKVAALIENQEYPAGFNYFVWDGQIPGRKIEPGIYIYRLFATSLEEANLQDDWVSGTLGIIWSPAR